MAARPPEPANARNVDDIIKRIDEAVEERAKYILLKEKFAGPIEIDPSLPIPAQLLMISNCIVHNNDSFLLFYKMFLRSGLLSVKDTSTVAVTSFLKQQRCMERLPGFFKAARRASWSRAQAIFNSARRSFTFPPRPLPSPSRALKGEDCCLPSLSYDELARISDAVHCIEYLKALGDAGFLDPLLEDGEFQRLIRLFSGRKGAQKYLFFKKFSGEKEREVLLASEILCWCVIVAAIAVGVCVAVKGNSGWMLGSGLAHACVRFTVGLSALLPESAISSRLLTTCSLASAGLLYLHVTMPKATKWVELSLKVLSPMVLCADMTPAFLVVRHGFLRCPARLQRAIHSFPRYPASLKRGIRAISATVEPKYMYFKLFVLPSSWPLLSLLASIVAIILLWV